MREQFFTETCKKFIRLKIKNISWNVLADDHWDLRG